MIRKLRWKITGVTLLVSVLVLTAVFACVYLFSRNNIAQSYEYQLRQAVVEHDGRCPTVRLKARFFLPTAVFVQFNIIVPELAQDRVVILRKLCNSQLPAVNRADRQQYAQHAAREQQRSKHSCRRKAPSGVIADGLLGAVLPRKRLPLLLVGIADIQAVQAENRQIQPDPVPEDERRPVERCFICQLSAVTVRHTQAEQPLAGRCGEYMQQKRLQKEHRQK